jgi:hypothetical protein
MSRQRGSWTWFTALIALAKRDLGGRAWRQILLK